jgi:hypothetical protein
VKITTKSLVRGEDCLPEPPDDDEFDDVFADYHDPLSRTGNGKGPAGSSLVMTASGHLIPRFETIWPLSTFQPENSILPHFERLGA